MAGTLEAGSQRSGVELLIGAFKDRRRVALVAAGVMLLAVVLAVAITPKYVATSALLLLLGSEYTARVDAGQTGVTTAALGRDEMVKSETEILGGPALHEATIRRIGLDRLYPDMLEPPGLVGQARDWLADRTRTVAAELGMPLDPPAVADPVRLSLRRFDRALDVLALKDGNVIEVTFRHKDAAVAADTVNTLIALYLQRRQTIYVDAQSGIVAARTQAAMAEVAAADATLQRFRAEHGIANFEAERDLLLHRRDDAARAAALAAAALPQATARIAAMAGQLAALPPRIEFYHDTDIAGRITNVKATVEALRAKLAAVLTQYQPDSRPALDLGQQIADQDAALRGLLRDRSATSDRVGRNPARDAVEMDQAHAMVDLAAAEAAYTAAQADVLELDRALRALDDSEPMLRALTRRRDALEDDYRALAHLMQERRMVEDAQARAATSVRVIEPAFPPAEPHRLALLILIGGALLSLVAGAATAVLSDTARRTFLCAARLERQLQLPVLASVPDVPGARARWLGPPETTADPERTGPRRR